MKKVATFLSLCFGLAIFTGCEKDEYEIVNKLSGDWKVTKLTYQLASGDSVVIGPELGRFSFGRCKWQKESDNRCDGYYSFSGQNQVAFGYNAVEQAKSMTLYVEGLPRSSDYTSVNEFIQAQAAFWGGNQPNLNGSWRIQILTDKVAQLEGTALLGYLGDRTSKTASLMIEMAR